MDQLVTYSESSEDEHETKDHSNTASASASYQIKSVLTAAPKTKTSCHDNNHSLIGRNSEFICRSGASDGIGDAESDQTKQAASCFGDKSLKMTAKLDSGETTASVVDPSNQQSGANADVDDSSSETDDQLSGSNQAVTRSAPSSVREIYALNRKRKSECSDDAQGLGLPSSIKRMFSRNSQASHVDDPSLHSGRLRSFPHEQGNWATHVFIPVHRDVYLVNFVQHLVNFILPGRFEVQPEFHVSLSRTVVIRHHWIDPLVDSLRQELGKLSASVCDIVGVKLYTNDEKTRTFVCLELAEEDTELVSYVASVDKCFKEFKLQEYYENPSFHISVGWCLGNMINSISQDKLHKAKEMLTQFTRTHPDLSIVYAQQVCCRSGNKTFAFSLKDS